MLDILGITGPIYIAIALGYAVTRAGLFSRADMRVLGKFVIHVALPAMLFNALSQRRIQEIVNGPYLLVYTLGSLLTLALGWAWARRGAGQDATTSVYYAMGMCCSNSGFVAFPIALLVIGPMAGVMLGLNMIVENLLVLPLLLALAEASTGQGGRWYVVLRQSLLALARNPMVLGLIAGFIVSWMGWRVPSPMDRSITLFMEQQQQFRQQMGGMMGQTPWTMMNQLTERNMELWQEFQRNLSGGGLSRPSVKPETPPRDVPKSRAR